MGRRKVQMDKVSDDEDSDKVDEEDAADKLPIAKQYSKQASKGGVSKRPRTSEAGADAADERPGKRQHSSEQADAEQADTRQAPEAEAEAAADADVAAAAAGVAGGHGDQTPFAAAAAADADDTEAAAAEDGAAAAAQGTAQRKRSNKGAQQRPARQPSSRLPRQSSKLENREPDTPKVSKGKKGSGKASQKQPKQTKQVQDDSDTEDGDSEQQEPKHDLTEAQEEVVLEIARKHWEGWDMEGAEEWKEGRDAPIGDRPKTEIDAAELPLGQSAVGWGVWEFYEDKDKQNGGTWYREIIADYRPSTQEYLIVPEDADIVLLPKEEFKKWPDEARVFCLPPTDDSAAFGRQQEQLRQQQEEQSEHPHEQEQQEQSDLAKQAEDAKAAAFPAAQTEGSTPGKGSRKRKPPGQQAQQRGKQQQRKGHQQQQQAEGPAAERQQRQHDQEGAQVDEHEKIVAAAADAAAALAAGEGAPAAATGHVGDQPATGPAAEGEEAPAEPSQPPGKPAAKKQQQPQQRTPKKQPQAGRPASAGAAAAKGGKKGGPAAAAATGGVEGAEQAFQQQGQAAQLQQWLEQLHTAVGTLQFAFEQQQEALRGILKMKLSPAAGKQLAAEVSGSSEACADALKQMFGGVKYAGFPPADEFRSLVNDVKSLGGRLLPILGSSEPGADQQQQQARPGAAAAPSKQGQQQQQRRDRPSSGGGSGPQQGTPGGQRAAAAGAARTPAGQAGTAAAPAAGRCTPAQNGVAAAAPAQDLSTFLEACAQLVPLRPLHNPQRDRTVALLAAVLHPQDGFSPFAIAQELEQRLQERYASGMKKQGQQGKQEQDKYLRHLQVIWDVLGGRDLEAAEAADRAAQEAAAEAEAAAAAAAAEGAEESEILQQAKAEAEEKAAAAAREAAEARERFEGVSGGDAGGGALRKALLEGRLSAQELFDVTSQQLAGALKTAA